MKKILILFFIVLTLGGISYFIYTKIGTKNILETVPNNVKEIGVINGKGISNKLLLNYLGNIDEIEDLFEPFNLFDKDSLAIDQQKISSIGLDWFGGIAVFRYPYENRQVLTLSMFLNSEKDFEKWLNENTFSTAEKLFSMKDFKVYKWENYCVAFSNNEVYIQSFQKSLFMDFGRNMAQMDKENLSKVLAPLIQNKIHPNHSFYHQHEGLINKEPWDVLLINEMEDTYGQIYLTLDNGQLNCNVYMPKEAVNMIPFGAFESSQILRQTWSWNPKEIKEGLETVLALGNVNVSENFISESIEGLTGRVDALWLDIKEDTIIEIVSELNEETFEIINVEKMKKVLKPIFQINLECIDTVAANNIAKLISEEITSNTQEHFVLEAHGDMICFTNDFKCSAGLTTFDQGDYFHVGNFNLQHPTFNKFWSKFEVEEVNSLGEMTEEGLKLSINADFKNKDLNAFFLLIHDALLLNDLP